ncbi:hypothetical protein evm_007063 [Chilo suppressalis]|nr:hypothetical protein evm_007063 [Chilo suppressalis]
MRSAIKYFHRNYSNSSFSYTSYKKIISPDIESKFKSSLRDIVDDICLRRSYLSFAEVKDKIFKAAEYNANNGNNPSGIILLHSYNILDGTASLATTASHEAFVLAWAIEMLHSCDILDGLKQSHGDQTRNRSHVDTCHNANLLRSFSYTMLEDKCCSHRDILKFFNKGFLYMALRNHTDLYLTTKSKVDKFVDFNLKNYELLSEYKTAYNTFKLPLLLSMQLTRVSDDMLLASIDKIGSDLSKLHQMKEEYEDCFGGESKTYRSAGVNIQRGKCTWLAVTALERCTSAQRIVFNSCYGSDEPAHVERIKLLYERLGIPQLYRDEQGDLCERIMQVAESIEESGIPLELFSKLLDVMCLEKSY